MAQQVILEEAAGHLAELVRKARGGQEIFFTEGHRPVAKLVPLGDDTPTVMEIASLAMAGGAFDWLADEPDLYDEEPTVRISALLRQWQQEFGLPTRPDGKGHTTVEDLFAQWDQEDAGLTPEEANAEQRLWEDRQKNHQAVSL